MKKLLTFDLTDAVFLVGLALLSYGAYAVYWPLGFVVPGAVLTAVGLWTARPPAPPPEK